MNENGLSSKAKEIGEQIGTILGRVAYWFISAVFIWWGWRILAPHLNAPEFTYWETFAIRMGLSYVMAILWQKDK